MGLTHTFLYPLIIKTRSFFLNLLLRFLVFLILTLSTLALFYSLSGLPALNFAAKNTKVTTSVMDVFIYLVLIELIIGLTITLRRNLGNTYLNKLIRHAYFTPKDEYRVFMFTDLKNSTALVEKMGSLFFSKFIQECFKDFSNVALDHGGEVYQFVGDEVVTTWRVSRNFDYLNCISLHLALCVRLLNKKQFYLDNYGTFPEFRTSLHSGNVSVALVGEYKTEIAYHGGALNLCSRLQSVCRAHEADLVISESFYQHIAGDRTLNYSPIADIELKGIAEKQLVYQVLYNS
jgi:adenylate cyclase